MAASLLIAPASFEPVYGWFEDHPGVRVEVWGLDDNRRAALLAYSDGPGDGFGWSNWAGKAYDDPSELLTLFAQLEVVVEDAAAADLKAAFPDLFVTGQAGGPAGDTAAG